MFHKSKKHYFSDTKKREPFVNFFLVRLGPVVSAKFFWFLKNCFWEKQFHALCQELNSTCISFFTLNFS
jgi:hypothetical protein